MNGKCKYKKEIKKNVTAQLYTGMRISPEAKPITL